MKTTRRGFLVIGGGAAAAAATALSGCKTLERGYPEHYEVEKPPVPGVQGWQPGEERFLRSACLQCEGGCGIDVRVVEGRAVKIEGNPDFPTNQGGLCPKGMNGLQVLYDPDRIRGPLRRIGERGEGKWQSISWDDAMGQVAGALRELRAQRQTHTVAILAGRSRGHMRDLIHRFWTAYGSPNEIDHESLCARAPLAHFLSQGIRNYFAYDWENTRYVLSFGAGFIESFRPTAMMLRIFGHMRGSTTGRRTKIVQIDPRFGVSSARADEWVPIRPGTDAALALGLAHVILRDGLFDKQFVRNHTLGLERWTDASGRSHQGWSDLVLEHYAPERVAQLTDVRAETIERLAHEFAAHRPAVAVSGRGAAAHFNGIYNCLAIHALNALMGSIDTPGGVLVQQQPPLASWPAPEMDEIARRGIAEPRFDLIGADAVPFADSRMADLARQLEEKPYPLNVMFLYYTNPLFSAPVPNRLRAALKEVPLIVSFSPFMDESTMMADLVLPDNTYLERWQLESVTPSVGFPVASVRQPVVEPLHDTRSTGEVFCQIARALGGGVARSFPDSELDMIKRLARGIQESKRGSVQDTDFDKFWQKLLAAGGWWNGPYRFGDWKRVLATPSGKYEFFSTRLDQKLSEIARRRWPGKDSETARAALLTELGLSARGDEACLPHYEPVPGTEQQSEYPFVLLSYKTMTHAEGRGANQPHLQELYGIQFDRMWEPWVEVNPEDARALGVSSKDYVWLRSPAGRVRLKAVVSDEARPGVLHVPFEYGHTAYGRWAANRGENVNPLLVPERERLGGGAAWYDARVDLTKA